MECLAAILPEALTCLWPSLKARAGYMRYKKKVEKLKDSVDELEASKNDIQRSVDAARRRGEAVNDVVTAWLKRVTELEADVSRMSAQIQESKKRFYGFFPDFASRYRLGKEASQKALDAEELRRQGNFSTVSQPLPPPSFESKPGGDFMAFSSTREAMKKVMDALDDDNMHLIGIYGMGGVGKTTIMEEVGRRVKESNIFDIVVRVVVSQKPDLGEIRHDIAERLGLKLSTDGELAAATLAMRLKKENRVLILLDDLWARLELKKEVGIPYGDDHKGCKILLTTRRSQVCHVMETDVAILVDVLSDDDSWNLFKSKAGDVIESSDLENVPRKVVKECGGLPLAIVVVGRALRGCNKKSVWDSALMQLKRSIPTNLEDMEGQLFKCLELSYNYMKDVETKLVFLFCCLFREDYHISEDELTRYAVGEGFLKNVYTLEEARGRVRLLVEDLIASCLLLSTEKETFVKMHDVVRDVAIYIASKGEDSFFVRAGLGMREWPEGESLEDCKRISLMNNYISSLPDQPKCPKVMTLLLNFNQSLVDMPNNFFVEMIALTVLDLSDTNIELLPSSLACLNNLGTLRLDRCIKLRDISLIGQLKKLKILGLQKCPLKVLPEEVGTLVKLKLLDLSYCTFIEIPPNLICKLFRLEELYLRSCIVNEALLVEIASLKSLKCLQVYLRDTKCFSQDMAIVDVWETLSQFVIYSQVDWYALANQYQKNFYLREVSSIANWTKILLKKAEDLILDRCKWDHINLAQLDEQNGFEGLKKLRLTRCHHIECLMNTEQVKAPPNAFGSIEVLNLWNIKNLTQICKGPLPAQSFGRLKILDIMRCKKLAKVLPPDFLQRVHRSLQDLAVKECDELHEVFNFEGFVEWCMVLPNLRKLALHGLPNLTTIWSGVVPPGSMQNITAVEVIGCNNLESIFSQKQLGSSHSKLLPPGTFSNLKEIKIWRCGGLKYLFLPSLAHELRSLERLELKNNDAMEEIIAAEDGVVLDKGAFPLLKDLLLINLTMLNSFYNGEPSAISFDWPSLKYIKLGCCPNLKRLPIGFESVPMLKEVHVEDEKDEEWFQELEWEDASILSRFQICQSSADRYYSD